jgi:hypothetical protein
VTGALVAKIVKALERYYDAAAHEVGAFIRPHDDADAREVLLLREQEDGLELALMLPRRIVQSPPEGWTTLSIDERCQVVEGASHFLMVCERARKDRSTTQLELELQAEIDKWLVLSNGGRLAADDDRMLRAALYEGNVVIHEATTVEGERYRLANALAARFVHRLATTYAHRGRFAAMRSELARFFRMGQEEKLRAIAA